MNSANKTVTFSLTLLSSVLIVYILYIAKSLLVPFIVAVLIWYLINTIAESIKKIKIIGDKIPYPIAMLFSIIILSLFIWALVSIITNNVAAVINAAPRYQSMLQLMADKIDAEFNIRSVAKLNEFIRQINLQNTIINIYGVFTSITSNAVIIVLYIVFLFVEQQVFLSKFYALFPYESGRNLTLNIVSQIIKDTQTYLGIKTLTSVFTSVTSWLIMKHVGLDFAEFWALLIFFLSFIPNIGAIIATAFPAVLAAIQFTTWTPFIIVTAGLTSIQFLVGSLIEPRLMGHSLNVSPLVILISLAAWGSLWGVIGMFLSIPITVMIMIICSHFEGTRAIAVLLSQNGKLKSYKDAV